MTKKICDRCGKEVGIHLSNGIYIDGRTYDLCSVCNEYVKKILIGEKFLSESYSCTLCKSKCDNCIYKPNITNTSISIPSVWSFSPSSDSYSPSKWESVDTDFRLRFTSKPETTNSTISKSLPEYLKENNGLRNLHPGDEQENDCWVCDHHKLSIISYDTELDKYGCDLKECIKIKK